MDVPTDMQAAGSEEKPLIVLPKFFVKYLAHEVSDLTTEVQPLKQKGSELVKNATETQQGVLGKILDITEQKFQIPQEPFDNFLQKSSAAIQTLSPLHPKGRKITDQTLLHETTSLNETMKLVCGLFTEWKKTLDGCIDVYRNQVPHPKTYLDTIVKIDQNYQKISSDIIKISKIKDLLRAKIKERMAQDNLNYVVPEEALKIFALVYDDKSIEEIKQDISTFHMSTHSFRYTKEVLDKEHKAMNTASDGFLRSFCLLPYLIFNQYQCTWTTETVWFEPLYKCNSINYLTTKETITKIELTLTNPPNPQTLENFQQIVIAEQTPPLQTKKTEKKSPETQ